MTSPFPGMDPYLEAHWGDVHSRLIVYASNLINVQLPPQLQARVEESLRVELAEEDDLDRTIYRDVAVVEGVSSGGAATAIADPIVVAEPYLIVQDEDRPERHVVIVDTSEGDRVVTAIEFLSPKNKIGRIGREVYRRKQENFFDARINLVEIDLIRQGHYVLSAPQSKIPPTLQTPYMICIRRAVKPLTTEVYAVPLRDPLPNIPIPLREKDKDVVLQLQPLVNACYRDGGHWRTNYREPAFPPLRGDDAQWAAELLNKHQSGPVS